MQSNHVNFYLHMIRFTHAQAIVVLVNEQLVEALAICAGIAGLFSGLVPFAIKFK